MHRLNVIQGIGIAVENRLCRAGIKSCNQLADTSPQQIREILGYLGQGSDVEYWIARARDFVRQHSDDAGAKLEHRANVSDRNRA